MTGTFAVVAHFDPHNKLDPTLETLIACLRKVCARVILVSTSALPQSEVHRDPGVTIIERPNIGYDFYSYKVGLREIDQKGGCESVFLINSSFVVTDPSRFVCALKEMLRVQDRNAIVGLVESQQYARHLQSFMLLIGRAIMQANWFRDFVTAVEPKNAKIETIVAYEIGLSQAALASGVQLCSLYEPKLREKLGPIGLYLTKLVNEVGLFTIVRRPRAILEGNPTQFAAEAIARTYGIVKTEVLRDNPHQIDLSWLQSVVAAEQRAPIDDFIARVRQRSDDHRETHRPALPPHRLVCASPLGRPGVSVAVVAHVFYPELLGELKSVVSNIVEPFDLIVTTPFESIASTVFETFHREAQGLAIAVAENKGRDVAPFLSIYLNGLLNPYDAVLKLHTKKSTYSAQGARWRSSIFSALCGTSIRARECISMVRRSDVGLVGPQDYYLSNARYWGGNREMVSSILSALGGASEPSLGFFAGTMFWFKPSALRKLAEVPPELNRFDPEAGQQDGTLAHAYERLFSSVARLSGFKTTSVQLDGVDLSTIDTDANTVPVL